jgi:hypothetical protein
MIWTFTVISTRQIPMALTSNPPTILWSRIVTSILGMMPFAPRQMQMGPYTTWPSQIAGYAQSRVQSSSEVEHMLTSILYTLRDSPLLILTEDLACNSVIQVLWIFFSSYVPPNVSCNHDVVLQWCFPIFLSFFLAGVDRLVHLWLKQSINLASFSSQNWWHWSFQDIFSFGFFSLVLRACVRSKPEKNRLLAKN